MSTQPVDSASSHDRGEYLVVARRYRPQTFQELIGQGQVAQALTTAIETNRVGHAYLFCGARGVGKTSAARILAKALNCQQGLSPTPCNACDVCQGIATGEDLDVLEIDGASNRGIEEIRQLRANVSIRPSRTRFKIYIIDEVHMLTLPAFNALLKTLEEPPEHVKFIFCTTDPEKIPITILSRCQRFDFPPVRIPAIVERLRFIVEREGVTADTEALQLLARRANGSMRDSQSLLEQLLSCCGNSITAANVHAMLGTARGGQVAQLAERLVERDAAGALRELDSAIGEGVEAGQLTEQLSGYFRDILTTTVGCGPEVLLHTASGDYPQLQRIGERLGLATLLAMLQILDQAVSRMRHSTFVRTLLELAVVRICQLEDLEELADVVAELRLGSSGPEPTSDKRTAASGRPVGEKKKEVTSGPELAEQSAVSADHAVAPHHGDHRASTMPAMSIQEPSGDAIWQQALAELADMTADFARQADRIEFADPNRLVASFRSGYILHKEYCERPERRVRLEAALTKVAGRPVRLDLELLPGSSQADSTPVPAPTSRQRMQERQRQPLVRQAIELFDGEVLRIDEPRKEPQR